MGRGLFTTAAVQAGQPLLSVPDVCTIAVEDPENAPPWSMDPSGMPGGEADSDEGSGPFYSAHNHEDYLRRWQAHHSIRLPRGLRGLLSDATSLPAPARLALWLLWLRRKCGAATATTTACAAAATAEPELCSGGQDATRGLTFWRSYLASMPAPRDMTCLSVFSEEEAELLQVPGYNQQWQRTRDSLSWLLAVANEALADDEATADSKEASYGKGGAGDGDSNETVTGSSSSSCSSSEDHGCGTPDSSSSRSSTGSICFTLEDLCYCYSLATSRCFHLPGRMLLVPYADLGNHQPLWQAAAFPFWQSNGPRGYGKSTGSGGVVAGGGGERSDAGQVESEEHGDVSGWFQFRAVRDLDPGTEVCICYSEGGNAEQLFSYGFVRQANPYDRLDLTPQELRAGAQDADDGGNQFAAGIRLCWPAVVAAAGFWAPQPSAAPSPPSGNSQGRGNGLDAPAGAAAAAAAQTAAVETDPESAAALEQSLLRPRGSAALRITLDPDPATRMRLQRRRAALLSVPHDAGQTAELRDRGLGWAVSPEAELRRWAREQAAAAAVAGGGGGGSAKGGEHAVLLSELAAVEAVIAEAVGMQDGMSTSLSYDEAVWRALATPLAPPLATDVPEGSAADIVGDAWARGLGLIRRLAIAGHGRGHPAAAAAAREEAAAVEAEAVAAAAVYDSPRGRTALLARLEHKRVLAQAIDILMSYRRVVESALAGCR